MPIIASDVTNAISQIYLYSVQDIQQTVTSLQEINLDCSGKTQEICLNCQTEAKKILKNNADIAALCNQACTCKIENINLNEIISVDLKNQSYNLTDEQLSNQIVSILNAKLKQSGDSSLAIPDTASDINKLVSEIIVSTTQVSEAGFATLIMWIVKIVIIFVFILALMATIDLSLQIYQKISD